MSTKQDRAYLLYLQGGECADCCTPLTIDTMELDHLLPVSLGGPTQWNNLRAVCGACNRKKGANGPPFHHTLGRQSSGPVNRSRSGNDTSSSA